MTVLLDTNVVSELLRPQPAHNVVRWLSATPPESIRFSAVGVAEILLGIELLPASAKRDRIRSRFLALLERSLQGKVAPFDDRCALRYAQIVAFRRSAGRPISNLDAQIAAIARANDLVLATRNTRDFDQCGVDVVDPFVGG